MSANNQSLTKKIHEANLSVHKTEAFQYDLRHPEIWSKHEQTRLKRSLRIIDRLITSKQKTALDFGAGTGNITDKLLDLGYCIWAIDISPEMCKVLADNHQTEIRNKQLNIINAPIEEVDFKTQTFDIVACYSVIHHIPDYLSTIKKLAQLLKANGVMYLDHEASPAWWSAENSYKRRSLKKLVSLSDELLNKLYLTAHGVFPFFGTKLAANDYSLADYWTSTANHLDHEVIRRVFADLGFGYFERFDYHLYNSWLSNPLFDVYRRVCVPNMSCWIAKK